MATGKSFTTYLANKILDHIYGKTTYTAPATKYYGLHIATTLQAGAASGQAVIHTVAHIPVGAAVVIDPLGTPESFTVLSISGSGGNYTVTLSGNLANARLMGVYVKFDFADDGTDILEPTGIGSYARPGLTNNTTNYPNASAASKSNATAITFAAATADWGLVTHIIEYDAITAGNAEMYGALTTPQLVQNAGTFSIPISNQTISLD